MYSLKYSGCVSVLQKNGGGKVGGLWRNCLKVAGVSGLTTSPGFSLIVPELLSDQSKLKIVFVSTVDVNVGR